MPANSKSANDKSNRLKVWTAPSMQVAKVSEAKLDLSLQNFDGILYQAS